MEQLNKMAPNDVRALIREGKITGPTAGMSGGYAQANLVILKKDLAFDFLLFCQRNQKPCPVLDVTEAGSQCRRWSRRMLISERTFQNTVFTGRVS